MKTVSPDMEHATLRESVVYICRALRLIWQSSPKWALVNMLFVLLRGMLPLALLWVVKMVMDVFTQYVSDAEARLSDVLWALAAMGGIYVVSSIAGSLHAIVKEMHGFRLSDTVATLIHSKTTAIGYHYFEDANYQNMFYRAINESSSRPQAVFYNMVGLLQNSLSMALMAAMLVYVHWALPLAIALIGVPLLLYRIRFSRKYFNLLRQQTDDERRVSYYNRILTAKEFAKEVRVFGLANHFSRLYHSTLGALRAKRLDALRRAAWRQSIIELCSSVLIVGSFAFVVAVCVSVGELAMYFMAMHRCYGMAQDVMSRISALYESNLFLKNFFEYIDLPTGKADHSQHFPVPMAGGIELRNVSFKYPNTERTVLHNVSLSIRQGETIAVVGRNGSGKSTLIKLICGLYEPYQGQITMGGVPLGDIYRSELSQNVSAIFQDFMLYNASAADNVWFGNVDEPNEPVGVRRAAAKAGIHDVFASLPKGYATKLGNLFADSEMLSQGEWQRTALARSFFNDAQVIVLDEPTSSLDSFTEAGLIDNFRSITEGRTAIVVSHRLSTIRLADRIVVLKDKGIDDVGTFDELMAKRGFFFEMVEQLAR